MMLTGPSPTELRAWVRRHTKHRQCQYTLGVGPMATYYCTRRRGHLRWSPIHFNVFFRKAWLDIEHGGREVDYPDTREACRLMDSDAGRIRGSL